MATGLKKQFTGAAKHVLDDKSRVIIPIKWREALGEELTLVRSLDGTQCIWGYARSDWLEFFAELQSSVDLADVEAHRQLRFVSSASTEVEVDKQGRVPVSAELRNHAMIAPGKADPKGHEVKIVGMGIRFEIWDLEKYDQSQSGVETAPLLAKLDQFRKKDKAE